MERVGLGSQAKSRRQKARPDPQAVRGESGHASCSFDFSVRLTRWVRLCRGAEFCGFVDVNGERTCVRRTLYRIVIPIWKAPVSTWTRNNSDQARGARRRGGPDARASSPRHRLSTLALATALALLALAQARSVHAQTIGDIDVRSRLGERFFAAVPVQTDGAPLNPACIRVRPHPSAPEGTQSLKAVRIRTNPSGPSESIIIETAGTVVDPIVGLRLEVGCNDPAVRDFLVLGEGAPTLATILPPAVETTSAETQAIAEPPAPAQEPAPAVAHRAPAQVRPVARALPAGTSAGPTPKPAVAPTQPPPKTKAVAERKPPSEGGRLVVHADPELAANAQGAALQPEERDALRRTAELRARSDDHTAGLLALENRMATLQLEADKLKAQLERMLAAQATVATVQAPTAAVQPTTAEPSPVPVKQAGAPPVVIETQSAPSEPGFVGLLTDWRSGAGVVATALLAALAWTRRRRKETEGDKGAAPSAAGEAAGTTAPEHGPDLPTLRMSISRRPPDTKDAPDSAEATAEWPPRTVGGNSDEPSVGHHLPGARSSREHLITQKFAPSNERTVALAEPEEIVQQARMHYLDDGDAFKAIDLLEMAVAVRTDSPRPWQALFAIYRREQLPERYQRLMLSYRGTFGEDESFDAIKALGREIDADNPLYAVSEDGGPVQEPAPDLIERWLGVPLDFTAHLLANELHDRMMSTFSGIARKRKAMKAE